MNRKQKYIGIFGSLAAVAIIASYVAAVLLLTQTVPVVAAGNLSSTSCTSGPTPLTANASYYVVGVQSYIRFTCTADSRAYSTQGGIIATPTFTLPTPFTQLWSFRSTTGQGTTTCAGGTGAWQMTSGTSHTFPSGGSIGWDYCGLIPSTATADSTSFTVAWNA